MVMVINSIDWGLMAHACAFYAVLNLLLGWFVFWLLGRKTCTQGRLWKAAALLSLCLCVLGCLLVVTMPEPMKETGVMDVVFSLASLAYLCAPGIIAYKMLGFSPARSIWAAVLWLLLMLPQAMISM